MSCVVARVIPGQAPKSQRSVFFIGMGMVVGVCRNTRLETTRELQYNIIMAIRMVSCTPNGPINRRYRYRYTRKRHAKFKRGGWRCFITEIVQL